MGKPKPPEEQEPRKRIEWLDPDEYLRRHPIPKWRLKAPLEFLNDAFGGGFWPGQVYTVQGAPSAGKSSLGIQLASNAAKLGCKVYILSSDEGTRAACVRLGQAAGINRDSLEHTEPEALAALRNAYALGLVHVLEVDAPEAVWETFLEQIEEETKGDPIPPFIYGDSIQSISTARDAEFQSGKERIVYVMEMARDFTRRTGAMVFFVSHVNRQHFAAKKEEDRIDPMAAAAEAIEIVRWSDVLLDLSGDRHAPTGVKAWLRKNRLHKGLEPIVRLEYNFDRGEFTEIPKEKLEQLEADQKNEKQRERDEKKAKRQQEVLEDRANRIANRVGRRPGFYTSTSLAQSIGGRKEDVLAQIDRLSDPKNAARSIDEDEKGKLWPWPRPAATELKS